MWEKGKGEEGGSVLSAGFGTSVLNMAIMAVYHSEAPVVALQCWARALCLLFSA